MKRANRTKGREITVHHINFNGVTVRPDGLRVFTDGDKYLDRIRVSEPDARKVILAVALRRAQQIAVNYAKKYAPHLSRQIASSIRFIGQTPMKEIEYEKRAIQRTRK